MTERRNFDPAAPRSEYEGRHIRFQCVVDVDLHNVGGDFELSDAQSWLNDALERGLKSADPNDGAKAHGAILTSRPNKKTQNGIDIITAERKRQIEVKGYTPEHDDEHDLGELSLAAALYALPYDAKQGDEPLITQADFIGLHITLETGCDFYLDPEPHKLKRLAKAGALIAAEIDRVIRSGEYNQESTNGN